MLEFLTLGIMAAVAYASVREGVLTAITTLVNVVLAGLVSFNFYEPLAAELEKMFKGTFLAGFEDAIVLFVLFAGSLGLLRVITNNLALSELELPALFQQVGAGCVALVTGYLVAGFLTCLYQTLPWDEKFMGFEYTADANAPAMRKLLPPDRVWLALMHRASALPLSKGDSVTFDPDASFELRYARLRRFKEQPQQPQ
jgi:hypothetical protein